MKDTVRPIGHKINEKKVDTRYTISQDIIDYYSQVGLDYEPWSANYNMHFGYYSSGLNPFNRESLLVEMNKQILARVNIDKDSLSQIIDLGCGVGATARYCAQQYDNAYITGATIVPWQIEKANFFNQQAGLSSRISINLADYRDTPFENDSFNGAYAVESSCYADGLDKASLINEVFRILKPGAKFVVADGFRKREKSSRLFEKAFSLVCKGWSVDTFANIHAFEGALKNEGFIDVKIEEASWRVLPSVLHVPWVSLKYFLKNLLFTDKTEKMQKKQQKMHFIAPVMGMVIGLHRQDYAYYIVSATKPD